MDTNYEQFDDYNSDDYESSQELCAHYWTLETDWEAIEDYILECEISRISTR